MATIHSGSAADLDFLSEILRSGGLVAVPTETVYGLAAHALDPAACAKIFAAKGRPAHDPLIVHVADRAAADKIAIFNPPAEALASAFWPGPLTLVLPKHPVVPDIVTSGRDTVALRVPAHPLMRALLERSGLPLAAPSANPFGYVSPTTAAHVQAGLGNRIEHILDGGPCGIGIESTIVDARDPADPVILRPGGIPLEAISGILGRPVRIHSAHSAAGRVESTDAGGQPSGLSAPQAELAPGMLDRHYSPRTPLELRPTPFAAGELGAASDRVAMLCFARPPGPAPLNVYWLSESGDPEEAARQLFSLVRELDSRGYDRIVAEPAPATGLGLAINDRLRRAATQARGTRE